jgi:hypothetical protein
MSRAPRYNKNAEYRIISLPGQLWQLQHHKGGKGTKTYDPWKKIGLPLELDRAMVVLQAIDKPL